MSEPFDNDFLEESSPASKALDLHLVFRIEDEDYALNVSEVADILSHSASVIRPVPKTPPYLKGIMNIRGDMIPVICVRTKFMKPIIPYTEESCIVKVQFEEYDIGLIVDKVIGVEPIVSSQITSPPTSRLSFQNQFVKSIGKTDNGVRMIMSLEKLIF